MVQWQETTYFFLSICILCVDFFLSYFNVWALLYVLPPFGSVSCRDWKHATNRAQSLTKRVCIDPQKLQLSTTTKTPPPIAGELNRVTRSCFWWVIFLWMIIAHYGQKKKTLIIGQAYLVCINSIYVTSFFQLGQ